MEGWIVIPGWPKFQSRLDRHDPWLKSYDDQLDRFEYLTLTLAERGLLHDLRHAFKRQSGQLHTSVVPGYIRAKVLRKSLERLRDAGWIDIVAAKPPPIGRRFAARAGEDVRSKKDLPKKVSTAKPRDGRKRTGYRLVRGSHGVSYVPDPEGVDPLPNGWQG